MNNLYLIVEGHDGVKMKDEPKKNAYCVSTKKNNFGINYEGYCNPKSNNPWHWFRFKKISEKELT